MRIPLPPGRTAVVITDPQNDMLSPGGAAWALVQDEVEKNQVVPNLIKLRQSAAAARIPVFYSPHLYRDEEYQAWQHLNPAEKLMFDRKMYRQGTWGADWHPDLVPDDNTFVLSPHKIFSGFWANDLNIQLRQRNIDTLILAGMAANWCVESHLRDAVENGFKGIVILDATAGAGTAATTAAYTNYQEIAHEVTTTKEITERMRAVADPYVSLVPAGAPPYYPTIPPLRDPWGFPTRRYPGAPWV